MMQSALSPEMVLVAIVGGVGSSMVNVSQLELSLNTSDEVLSVAT